MNEALDLARQGIEQAEEQLRKAAEPSMGQELTETQIAVLMLAMATKELTAAVAAQDRQLEALRVSVTRLERSR